MKPLMPWLLTFLLVCCGCVAFAVAASGCRQLKEEVHETAQSVVDCTGKAVVQAIDEYGPTVEQVLVDAIDGEGKLDRDRAMSVVKRYTSDTAKCVLASTIARLLAPPSVSPDAPQSSPLTIDMVGLEALRKHQLGDQRFKLPSGATL